MNDQEFIEEAWFCCRIDERVERGAKWLDENAPGWFNLIDIQVLDIANVGCCVLGQVFIYDLVTNSFNIDFGRDYADLSNANGFKYGMKVLWGQVGYSYGSSYGCAALHGFDSIIGVLDDGDDDFYNIVDASPRFFSYATTMRNSVRIEYDLIADAWIRQIEKRLDENYCG